MMRFLVSPASAARHDQIWKMVWDLGHRPDLQPALLRLMRLRLRVIQVSVFLMAASLGGMAANFISDVLVSGLWLGGGLLVSFLGERALLVVDGEVHALWETRHLPAPSEGVH